ncbi:MAG TPA: endonuclease/exonuclease/phosphatase family protein [Polyangia bacterium]
MRRHRALMLTLALTVSACGSSSPAMPDGGAADGAAPDADAPGAGQAVVMTRNIYLGAALDPLVNAATLADVLAAVPAVLAQITATDFPARAQALAAEIAAQAPHLVGLQEVVVFALDGQEGPPPYRDYLADLLAALADQGAHYTAVATVQNLSFELPVPGVGAVSVRDRDVILARADVTATPVAIDPGLCTRSLDGCTYATAAVLNATALGDVAIPRGFVVVDATIAGFGPLRVVSTHLEIPDLHPADPLSASVQAAQAAELIATIPQVPNPAHAPLVVLGDMNSSPADATVTAGATTIVPPYAQLVAVYHDTWPLAAGGAPGFTCCQREDLLNLTSMLTARIDLVLTDWVPAAVTAALVGDQPADRTPTGLWPSDHAGVAVTLSPAAR